MTTLPLRLTALSLLLTIVSVPAAFAESTMPAQTTTTFATKPFSDVAKTHKYYEAIEWLRTQKVLKGYDDGTFKPDSRINRAEFVKLITNPYILDTERLNECLRENVEEDATTVFFKDAPRDSWYAAELCHAYVTKLINGYPDGTFRPGNNVIFVEAAKILSNVFALNTEEEPGEQWYKPYVTKLAEEKAIPTSIVTFDKIITRGEMAEILYRLKAHKKDKASTSYSAMY